MSANELRRDIAELARLADNDLAALWRQVSTAAQAQVALAEILPQLIETYGAAAATVAADWYDEAREKAGVGRRFVAEPAEVGDTGAAQLAGWGVGPLYAENPDWNAARVLIGGGLQRRIANAARDTIRGNSVRDGSADGWQRSASGGCDFCQMLAGRGAVYTEASADFASHDWCGCVAVPAFKGEPRPVKPYTPSVRDSSEADRARVREYLRTH